MPGGRRHRGPRPAAVRNGETGPRFAADGTSALSLGWQLYCHRLVGAGLRRQYNCRPNIGSKRRHNCRPNVRAVGQQLAQFPICVSVCSSLGMVGLGIAVGRPIVDTADSRRADFNPLKRNEFRSTKLFLDSRFRRGQGSVMDVCISLRGTMSRGVSTAWARFLRAGRQECWTATPMRLMLMLRQGPRYSRPMIT